MDIYRFSKMFVLITPMAKLVIVTRKRRSLHHIGSIIVASEHFDASLSLCVRLKKRVVSVSLTGLPVSGRHNTCITASRTQSHDASRLVWQIVAVLWDSMPARVSEWQIIAVLSVSMPAKVSEMYLIRAQLTKKCLGS